MNHLFIIPRAGDRSALLDRVCNALRALPAETGWRLEVHEHKGTRSGQQNRYLWGVVYPEILRQGGETLGGWNVDDLHEHFLGEYFGWETVSALGRTRQRPMRRSSRLSKTEFANYINFIQVRCTEYGIEIPDADPNYFAGEQAA